MNRYAVHLGAGPWLCLGPGVVPELLLNPRVTRLVNAPEHCYGVINLRGVPVLVLDPAPPLGIRASDDRKVLILDRDAEAIGLVIKGEPRLLSGEWHDATLSDPIPTVLAGFCGRSGQLAGVDVAEFDHRGFLKAIASGARA